MLKFICSAEESTIHKYIKLHSEVIFQSFSWHPEVTEQNILQFINCHSADNKTILTYNMFALDFVPASLIFVITEDMKEVPFKEMFKEHLDYLSPGEIILSIARTNKSLYQV